MQNIFIPDEFRVNKESVDLTFAGNIGKAQNLETILKAASLIEKNTNLPRKFNFILLEMVRNC